MVSSMSIEKDARSKIKLIPSENVSLCVSLSVSLCVSPIVCLMKERCSGKFLKDFTASCLISEGGMENDLEN